MSKYQGVDTLEVLEGANNYNDWIVENFVGKLKQPILEIGSGTGNISKLLHHTNNDVYLSDVDASLVKRLQENFPNSKEKIFTYDIQKNPPKNFIGFFKSIIAINVLEHIEHDTKALENISKCLQKNGYLLLLVPAKRFAYTKLDKRIGHFRRYEKTELIEKCTNAGFSVETIYFFNIVGLFSWVVRNKIDKGNIKPFQIKVFDTLVPFLKTIERKVKPPVGVSLVVIAKKNT